MPRRPRSVTATATTLAVVVVVVVAGGVWWWRHSASSAYDDGLDSVPASTLRFSWTDWASVRDLANAPAGVAGGAGGASAGAVRAFLDRAYEQDLTPGSSIVDTSPVLQRIFGFSGLDADWEAYAQGEEGAVTVLRLPGSTDFAGLEGRLRKLGYAAPSGGIGSDGVWVGGVDRVVQIDPSLTPVMQNVAVLGDQDMVLLSDDTTYLESAVAVARGDADSLAAEPGVADLAEAADDPTTSVLYASDFACEDLSMVNADEEDQTLADQLIARAGEVSPLSGFVMARGADGSFRFGMEFEDEDQARTNLATRVKLASGEAVGQGGTFRSRFKVLKASATGSTVRFDVRPRPGEQLLSDLAGGPVLFATC